MEDHGKTPINICQQEVGEAWLQSPERQEALRDWSRKPDELGDDKFEHSQEFANARQAYRKRMNG